MLLLKTSQNIMLMNMNYLDEKKEEIREDYFSQNFEELKEEICKVYTKIILMILKLRLT